MNDQHLTGTIQPLWLRCGSFQGQTQPGQRVYAARFVQAGRIQGTARQAGEIESEPEKAASE